MKILNNREERIGKRNCARRTEREHSGTLVMDKSYGAGYKVVLPAIHLATTQETTLRARAYAITKSYQDGNIEALSMKAYNLGTF